MDSRAPVRTKTPIDLVTWAGRVAIASVLGSASPACSDDTPAVAPNGQQGPRRGFGGSEISRGDGSATEGIGGSRPRLPDAAPDASEDARDERLVDAARSKTIDGGTGRTIEEPLPDTGCAASDVCETYCQALAAGAGCNYSDSDVPRCVCECQSGALAQCAPELSTLLECATPALAFDCSHGAVRLPGCERQSETFELCVEAARDRLCATAYPECRSLCEGMVNAECSAGPESLSNCLCGCEAKSVEACPEEWAALIACADGTFDVSCGEDGVPVVRGACEAEWADLRECQR